LVSDLVAVGCIIVSGIALEVDTAAAKADIATQEKTIAVQGSSVDLCLPAENADLYDRNLKSGGVIVSENHLGMTPNKGSFYLNDL
jgi:predicted Rossmann fold nucleotide-binding protein DprA/Smf involved in DNA uptake